MLVLAGAAFLMWEVSTPFVYMRWFLFTLGKSQSKAYIVNGLLMVATFFIFRNIMGVGQPPPSLSLTLSYVAPRFLLLNTGLPVGQQDVLIKLAA